MHLLTLDNRELDVLTHALVKFAIDCEAVDDVVDARTADEVCDRVRALDAITSSSWREWVRHAGVGPHKGKPQG